ncbi:Quinoprotein glucose dehydrogenase B [Planctomycetales bacterium 10988]|nr:Quinoprotein glucose dehydrogenase B [Planctomycetales bacterium 10988]
MTSDPHLFRCFQRPLSLVCFLLASTLSTFSLAQEKPAAGGHELGAENQLQAGQPFTPEIASASSEGKLAIREFQVAPGCEVELIAAEPLLANPVAFDIDSEGRFYVVETFRVHQGVTDNRRHMEWLVDDLATETVAERVEMYHKYLGENFKTFAMAPDRIRRLEDTTGDGMLDSSVIFAEGFNAAEDGIAAGVMVEGEKVYFTNIPDLYLFIDANGDGVADEQRSLSSGYGVHVSYLGHDLHGLRRGPDGRIYFSIGDRGFDVDTEDGLVSNPDTGAVFRCEPDGSKLEVVHYGLRNPQELAFDQWGNLFTVDNNSDSSDQARVVQIVEGGDSGWRIGYQYHQIPELRGPWNAEKLWHTDLPPEEQAASIVPPLLHLSDGPSGLTYHPGTSQLPELYKNHFLLSDFRGSPLRSGIRAFQAIPQGASFKIEESESPIWGILPTDCEFGPDGSFYVLDWVLGWDLPTKGRIYRVFSPDKASDPVLQETKELLQSTFSFDLENDASAAIASAVSLFNHPDQRVRQKAQFAFVESLQDLSADKTAKNELFQNLLAELDSPLSQCHAVWGMGQLLRTDQIEAAPVVGLLDSEYPEVRAQAAKVLGDAKISEAENSLIAALEDSSEPVQLQAAIALGKLQSLSSQKPLFAFLEKHGEDKPYLRHAGVMGLLGSAGSAEGLEHLVEAKSHESAAVRMAVLLTLRRLHSAELVSFLQDSNPRIVTEAARAIYDERIEAGYLPLTQLIDQSQLPDFVRRRAIAAFLRVEESISVEPLVTLAIDEKASNELRWEAVEALQRWTFPEKRDELDQLDFVTGDFHPLEQVADLEEVRQAVSAKWDALIKSPQQVRSEVASLGANLELKEVEPYFLEIIKNHRDQPADRVQALELLDQLESPLLAEALPFASSDKSKEVRAMALRYQVEQDPENGLAMIQETLQKGTLFEQQTAYGLIGTLATPAADAFLIEKMNQLRTGEIKTALQVELLETVALRDSPEINQSFAQYQTELLQKSKGEQFSPALEGGNRQLGKAIFFEKVAVSCQRCHKVGNNGGEVGPELTRIGKQKDRMYLLESIVDPSKAIAKGFETVQILTEDGEILSGILREETEEAFLLMTPQGEEFSVPKDEIFDQMRGPSAMPADLSKHLSLRELRDLVSYLAGLNGTAKGVRVEEE